MAGAIVVEMTGEEAKLFRAFEKIVDQQKKMEGGLDKISAKSRKAGKDSEEAFGGKALGSLKSYVAGVVSLTAVLGTVSKMLAEIQAVATGAGQRITDEASGRRALVQVSGGDQAMFRRLVGTAEGLRRGGMGAAEAYRTTFQAGSGGERFLRDAGTIGRLREIGFAPEAGIESAVKLQAAFGGERGAGDTRQIIDKILAAAGPSPVMADEIARAMSVAGPSFAQLGGQDEELLAMLAVMAEPFKTPEAASQKIKALADQLVKKRDLIGDKGAAGMSAMELIQNLERFGAEGKLRTEGGKRADVTKFLGETSAIQALYQYGQQRAQIEARTAEVYAAQAALPGEGLLAKGFRVAEQDPMLAAVTIAEKARQRMQISEEDRLAAPNRLAQALIDERQATARERGAWEATLTLDRWVAGAGRRIGGDRAWLRRQMMPTPSEANSMSPEMAAQIAGSLPQADLRAISRTNEWSGIGNSIEQQAVAKALENAARDIRVAAERMNQATGGSSLGKQGSDR